MTKEEIIKETLRSTFFDGKDYDEAYRCCDECIDATIEKACEWIFTHYGDVYDEEYNDCKYGEGWRMDFRKAMEA